MSFSPYLNKNDSCCALPTKVNLEPDLAGCCLCAGANGRSGPAIQFNKIAGYTDAHVAMNVHGSWPNHALALGMDKDTTLRDQFFEFVRRY